MIILPLLFMNYNAVIVQLQGQVERTSRDDRLDQRDPDASLLR